MRKINLIEDLKHSLETSIVMVNYYQNQAEQYRFFSNCPDFMYMSDNHVDEIPELHHGMRSPRFKTVDVLSGEIVVLAPAMEAITCHSVISRIDLLDADDESQTIKALLSNQMGLMPIDEDMLAVSDNDKNRTITLSQCDGRYYY